MLAQHHCYLSHAAVPIAVPPDEGRRAIQTAGLVTLQIIYQGLLRELFDH
jgi:hypothetical protein